MRSIILNSKYNSEEQRLPLVQKRHQRVKNIMKVLFFILSLAVSSITYLPSAHSQARHNVAFSIPANKARIFPGSKPFRVYGTVIVTHDGKVSSNITTHSNHFLLGFTGALKITFYDEDHTAIYEVVSKSHGVNRESSRINFWSTDIPKWVVYFSQFASAEGVRNSTDKTIKYILTEGEKYIKQYAASQAGG